MFGLLRRAVGIGLALVIAALLVTACSEKRIAWRGQNVPGRIAYDYSTFDGDERQSVDLEAGETLVIDYEADVTKGDLKITVHGPSGETVEAVTLREDAGATWEIVAGAGGEYDIIIEGNNTGGGFEVEWETS